MSTKVKNAYWIALMLFASLFQTHAQLSDFCPGSTGDPIFTEDFGLAPSTTPEFVTLPSIRPGAVTDYIFNSPTLASPVPTSGAIPDNYYHITNLSNGWSTDPPYYPGCAGCTSYDWFREGDHTTGQLDPTDPLYGRGRMLLINADYDTDEIFRYPVGGLCGDTTYEFSAWHANLTPIDSPLGSNPGWGTPKPIDIRFTILDANTLLPITPGGTGTTGTINDVLDSNGTGGINAMDWQQSALTFTTPTGVTDVILVMSNNYAGFTPYGNDIAVDDIVFRTCSTATVSIADALGNDSSSVCSTGTLPTLTIANALAANQWQVSVDGVNWIDIPGATSTTLVPPSLALITAILGTLPSPAYFRAKSAGSIANLSNSSCNVVTNTYTVTLETALNPGTGGSLTICDDQDLTLLEVEAQLGASYDSGGVWTWTDNTGTPVNSAVFPILTSSLTSSLSPYTFTYTHPATMTTLGVEICPEVSANVVVTIDPLIPPTFTQIGPICEDDTSVVLPTSSTNTPAITGTWNAAFDNTAIGTTTYTFTPTAGQCADVATMDIEVTALAVPAFTQIGPVCLGDTSVVLPTSSTDTPAITGTWNAAFDNSTLGTTTYTFTPAAGQCADVTTMDIEVTTLITPTFTQIGPICEDDTSVVLPTSSTNTPAITGTWNAAFDNTAIGTTTYTFTPTAGQCADVTTMDIEVTTLITPTFTQIGPICEDDTSVVLPTSSTNTPAITGTWNAAFDNTAIGTTTYTFTPTAGQCADVVTMDIEVIALTVPTFTQIGPICEDDTSVVLPTSSTNTPAITGTWNATFDNTAIGTTTYTFTPTAGQCADVVTMDIEVAALTVPTFTQIGPICEDDTSVVLPTSSTDTPAITGTWNAAFDNTAIGTTTYTFTPTAGQCADVTTMDIEVTTLITPTFTQIGPICEDDTSVVLPTSSTDTPAITGTWNAAFDNTAIGTSTYTFTPTAGQCADIVTMDIEVTALTVPTFTQIGPICEDDTSVVLPTSSTNTPAITGTWNAAFDNTAIGTTTYTFTPTAGECADVVTMDIEVTALTVPIFTQIGPICEDDTSVILPTSSTNTPAITGTWNAAFDNTAIGTTTYIFTPTAGQCADVVTMDIEVTALAVPTFTQIGPICEDDNSVVLPTSSTDIPAITGTWNAAFDNTAIGTTTYTFTPTAGQCADVVTMDIEVTALTIPTFNLVGPVCISDVGTILTALLPTSSIDTPAISGAWALTTDNGTSRDYTFTPTAGQCADVATMNVVVLTSAIIPAFTQVGPVCASDTGTILATLLPMSSTDTPAISGAWALTTDNGTSRDYTFTPTAGQCADVATMNVLISSLTVPTFTQAGPVCESDTDTILITLLPASSIDTPAISGAWALTTDNGTSRDYTFTPTAGQCADVATMNIEIIPRPVFSIQESDSFCVDSSGTIIAPVLIDTGLSTANYEFEWYLDNVLLPTETQGFITPDQSGTYRVAVTDLRGTVSPLCTQVQDVTEITRYDAPTVVATLTTEAFEANQIIIAVGAGGSGFYEYRLQNQSYLGPWTTDPVFANVPAGVSTIFVRDGLGGCDGGSDDVLVIGYPKYFTPNNDGVNETWNIDPVADGLANYIPNSVLYIYDRYGKLLKEIDPTNDRGGWDGNYNGEKMPSTDYWFVIEYDDFTKDTSSGERKQFKAHFTLKR